jgi:hypothetical protein
MFVPVSALLQALSDKHSNLNRLLMRLRHTLTPIAQIYDRLLKGSQVLVVETTIMQIREASRIDIRSVFDVTSSVAVIYDLGVRKVVVLTADIIDVSMLLSCSYRAHSSS